jgi:pyruvate dehydrogenase E2 component (dihydrolipoamide acetyltransferase)
MTYEVVMPQLGLTMEEGSVVSWNKQVGDRVTKGEVLFTVETDKTEMEVESADSGYLNSLQVRLGEKVRVGTVIAILGDRPGEVAIQGEVTAREANIDGSARGTTNLPTPPAKPGLDSEDSDAGGLPAQAPSSGEIASSPRARRLAKELGVDINAVKPARGNRIVEEDVRRFYESLQSGSCDQRKY